MTAQTSRMPHEILGIPAAAERLLTRGAEDISAAAQAVRQFAPAFAASVARGSSDHAASYLKYCCELLLGVPVASLGPSVASLYQASLALPGGLCLAVPQSGQSPDIVQMTAAARRGGALTVSLTNGISSPLKFKENCRIHAESYSSAEVLHGPVSVVARGFPVLCFAAADAAEPALAAVADQLAEKGAAVFVTSGKARHARRIRHVRTGHGLTDPLALMVSFYAMVERVAAERGLSPDSPRHLTKVTETL